MILNTIFFISVSKISLNIISKIAVISAVTNFVISNEIIIYNNYSKIKVVIDEFLTL